MCSPLFLLITINFICYKFHDFVVDIQYYYIDIMAKQYLSNINHIYEFLRSLSRNIAEMVRWRQTLYYCVIYMQYVYPFNKLSMPPSLSRGTFFLMIYLWIFLSNIAKMLDVYSSTEIITAILLKIVYLKSVHYYNI